MASIQPTETSLKCLHPQDDVFVVYVLKFEKKKKRSGGLAGNCRKRRPTEKSSIELRGCPYEILNLIFGREFADMKLNEYVVGIHRKNRCELMGRSPTGPCPRIVDS